LTQSINRSCLNPAESEAKQLAQATGLPVEWQDREFFRIERPANDTVERIRRFLAEYKGQ
jgi:hypothetical protein